MSSSSAIVSELGGVDRCGGLLAVTRNRLGRLVIYEISSVFFGGSGALRVVHRVVAVVAWRRLWAAAWWSRMRSDSPSVLTEGTQTVFA
jgi:hypothetical protein